VTSSAPRIPQRLLDVIDRHAKDDTVPLAEIGRRVGAEAEVLGITRPSYERVRELVHEARSIRSRPRTGQKGRRMLVEGLISGTLTRGIVEEFLSPTD
jgi:hypothetical protein